MDEISPQARYRFADFTLDLTRSALVHGGEELRLRGRTFDVLTYLVQNPQRVISKQELFEAVWGDVAVTDDSLVQCLVEIRKALGPELQGRVRTIRGKGYLFDHAVEVEPRPPTADLPAQSPQPLLELGHQPARGDELVARELPSPVQVRPTASLRRPVLLTVAGAAIALLAALVWRAASQDPVQTLAVLPFENAPATGAPSGIASGLHEEVVAALGQIDATRLRVLSSRSTAAYRGKSQSAHAIGTGLGADYLVEGRIREAEARWQVTFAVVRVRDQVQIWTATFDRDRDTFADLQTELARAVAQQVRLRLTPAAEAALRRRQARHPGAYEHYLAGRALWAQSNRAALYAAITEFEHATALDPEYALPYAGLADVYAALPITSDVPPLEVAEKARRAAEHAVKVDPLLAEAHAALGWQEFWFGWDWAAAEASLRRAIALDPNYANARRWLGHVLSNGGRHSEALDVMERAREYDPSSPLLHVLSSQLAYHARDFGLAERLARQVIAMDRNFWSGYLTLGQALAARGDPEGALAAFTEAVRLSGNVKSLTRKAYALGTLGRTSEAREILHTIETRRGGFVPPYELAVVHAGLSETEGVFAALDQALAVRDANLVFLPVDPKLEPFRADPRYQALVDRLGFHSGVSSRRPEEWGYATRSERLRAR